MNYQTDYPHLKYSSEINRICCENRAYFLFSYRNQKIPSGVRTRKSFDVSLTVKYSYHFTGLQWHVINQKITAAGSPEITLFTRESDKFTG